MPININRFGYIVCTLAVFFFLIISGVQAAKEKNGYGSNPAVMTQEELQSAVISYANRFFATLGQAAFHFEKKLPTPEAQFQASALKVYSLSAVTEIAAGPNPGAALLDIWNLASRVMNPQQLIVKSDLPYGGCSYKSNNNKGFGIRK